MKKLLIQLPLKIIVIVLSVPIEYELLQKYLSSDRYLQYLLIPLIFLILISSLFLLLDIIGLSQKRANIFIKIFNKFHYPRYIKYKDFIWFVNKTDSNEFYVKETPLCQKCCFPIIVKQIGFEEFSCECDNCNEKYDEYDFESN